MRDEPIHAVPKPPKAAKRAAKRRGTDAERDVAKRLGGRRVYKSGASPFEKGDVRVDDLHLFVEVKYVGTGRGLQKEWIEKTILDSKAAGTLPVVAVKFPGGDVYYTTTADVFETLVSQIRALKAQIASLEENNS